VCLHFHQPNDDIGVRVDAVLIPYNILASKIGGQEGKQLLEEGDAYNTEVALLENPVIDTLDDETRARLSRSGTGDLVNMARKGREGLYYIFTKALIQKMARIERR